MNIFIFLLIVAGLTACAGQDNNLNSKFTNQAAILGGITTTTNNIIKDYVVMVSDKPTRTLCTGSLIHKNLVLTAAHCVESGRANDISLAFGLNPMSGSYILRKPNKVVIHNKYKKIPDRNDRNDLALIYFKEGIPKNYKVLKLPDSNFPLAPGFIFTAAGYGRTSGLKSKTKDSQGSGPLRNVDLTIQNFSANQNQFYVDQTNGKGTCNGDSGGPALMRYQNVDYVVGVASASRWTYPAGLKGDEIDKYLDKKDRCRERSIFMNVKNFRPWIEEQSKALLK